MKQFSDNNPRKEKCWLEKQKVSEVINSELNALQDIPAGSPKMAETSSVGGM